MASIDVTEWLVGLKPSMASYAGKFIENGFDDFDIITKMDEADLLSCECKKGHIKKVLRPAIDALAVQRWCVTSRARATLPLPI